MDDYIASVASAFLQHYKTDGGTIEKEIRIGYINTRNTFVPNIHRSIFFNILSVLNVKNSPAVESVVSFDPRYENIREIRSTSGVHYEKKEDVIKNDDKLTSYHYGLRASVKRETIVTKPALFNPTLQRLRKRWSFDVYGIILDVSIVTQKNLNTGETFMTYEIEIEFKKDKKYSFEDIKNTIEYLYRLIYDTRHIISQIQISHIINEFDMLLASGSKNPQEINFRFPKPIDMSYDRYIHMLADEKTPYFVSPKADGIHSFLLINSMGAYIIIPPRSVNNIVLYNKGTQSNTLILEGELVTKRINDKNYRYFLAFDLLLFNGDIRNKAYSERIGFLSTIVNDYGKTLPIALKYIQSDSSPNAMKKLMSPPSYFSISPSIVITEDYRLSRSKIETYETDGYVFTYNGSYNDLYKKPILKWKPLDKLTIDFSIIDDGFLAVNYNNNLVRYRGSDRYPYPDGFRVDRNILSINEVGEFLYNQDKNKFELIRKRPDKDIPNYITVAQDTWNVMNEHISLKTLVGDDMRNLRRYHNMIKKKIILTHVKEASIVLDIGGGRGGDIDKYIEAKASHVIFIEPNLKNLEEMKNRLSRLRNTSTKFSYINAYGQDTTTIKNELTRLGISQVDVVASFFSLTFFFDSEDTLNGLMETIRICTNTYTKFIGTYMNGRLVENVLNKYDKKGFDVGFFSIKYDVTGSVYYTPRVIVNIPETIVDVEGVQYENLVYMDYIKNKMKMMYFSCIDDQQFLPNINMLSDIQNTINSFYSYFVFSHEVRKRDVDIMFDRGIQEHRQLEKQFEKQIERELVKSTTLMKSKLSRRDVLEPDVISILPVKMGTLFRIGSIADGSCFLHAFLYASLEVYASSDSDTRKRIVKDYRQEMYNNVDKFYDIISLGGSKKNAYKNHIKDIREWFDAVDIKYISVLNECNIIIINDKLELYSVNGEHITPSTTLTYTPCVVILNFDEYHYELLFIREKRMNDKCEMIDTDTFIFPRSHIFIDSIMMYKRFW